MTAFERLATTEAKLYLREPAAVFWGLAFPTVLLVVLGFAFPGAREPSPDLDGFRLVDVYAPIVLTLGLATVGLLTLPVVLATYRERGVLRRLATTPVGPRTMVGAQLAVHLGVAVVAAALLLVVAVAVFAIDLPASPAGFVVAFGLAAAAFLALGVLVGAVAATASTAQGIGMALYFPLLFFSGVYFPRQVMPPGLRTVSDLTPGGAAVQALTDAWAGRFPSGSSLVVMAGYAVVAAVVATLVFRWE